jgi:hypothetical protein
MAEDDKSLFSSVVQIIDKFINNAGFWLWISIFCGSAYALDYYSVIRLHELGNDKRDVVVVLFALSFCMLMNAINLHYHIWLAAIRTVHIIIDAIFYVVNSVLIAPVRSKHERQQHEQNQRQDEKNLEMGKTFFIKYMTVNCIERHWLVWFIFEWQPKEVGKPYSIQRTGGTTDDSWDDRIAWFMWTHYILREAYGEMWRGNRTAFKESYYFLKETFPLLDSLKDVFAANNEIRSEVIEVRKEVSRLNQFQLNGLKMPRYSDYEHKEEKDALIAARREFDPLAEKVRASGQ